MEITVTGAGALEASRVAPGSPVDVVVSGDAGPGSRGGRTYVAAERVPLLALLAGPGRDRPGGRPLGQTLALRREQALRVIRAEEMAGSDPAARAVTA